MNLAKIVGMAFVIIGVAVLALGLGMIYGVFAGFQIGVYSVTVGIVLIIIGAVLIVVLGTIKDVKAKSAMIQ